MNDFKYKLSLTDNQLSVLLVALEDYFRTRMNQWFDFATEVAKNGYEYDKDNPDNDRLFDAYIDRRNRAEDMFRQAFSVAAPDPYARRSTPYMETAIDIWHVLRYLRWKERPEPKPQWTVDSYPPRPLTVEPLPTIEPIETDEKDCSIKKRSLKHCPICGSEAVVMDRYRGGTPNRKMYWIECKKCRLSQAHDDLHGYNTITKAKNAWNRRVTDG